MSEKTISKMLKFAIVLMGAMCLAIHSAVTLIALASEEPTVRAVATPWIIFVWLTAVPMIPAIIYSWKTATNIGKNIMFNIDNAKNLHIIAISALADIVIVFFGGIAFLVANISHPTLFLAKLMIVAIGVAIFVSAEGLSQLIKRASALQEDADLTI
ncbi:MAG: DUF2975 domain-containing protein [Clostridia bacterium]|nr:DUF2975 domain-containing protein [Clostridia bacterium]